MEEGGIFLKSITPNGAAAKTGKMIVGKNILSATKWNKKAGSH